MHRLTQAGVLLVGAPGTGKTLLAKAVAGEATVPFFSLSGTGFVEMFVGVGAACVHDLFEQAQAKAPSILFIDELNALGKACGISSMMGEHDEREQTLEPGTLHMYRNFTRYVATVSSGIPPAGPAARPPVLAVPGLGVGSFEWEVF